MYGNCPKMHIFSSLREDRRPLASWRSVDEGAGYPALLDLAFGIFSDRSWTAFGRLSEFSPLVLLRKYLLAIGCLQLGDKACSFSCIGDKAFTQQANLHRQNIWPWESLASMKLRAWRSQLPMRRPWLNPCRRQSYRACQEKQALREWWSQFPMLRP